MQVAEMMHEYHNTFTNNKQLRDSSYKFVYCHEADAIITGRNSNSNNDTFEQ